MYDDGGASSALSRPTAAKKSGSVARRRDMAVWRTESMDAGAKM